MNATTTGITCGHCKAKHATVADVRYCAGQPYHHVAPSSPKDAVGRLAQPSHPQPASEKQLAFILSLANDRVLPAHDSLDTPVGTDANLDDLWEVTDGTGTTVKAVASVLIRWLLELPKKAKAPAPTATPQPEVPAGRYAVTSDKDGVTRFYRVDRPTEGRWAGYTFVKVQASDELHRVGKDVAAWVLAAIAKATPQAASKLYGQEIGCCGVCGRTLTDETSRANGIGPICAAKYGW